MVFRSKKKIKNKKIKVLENRLGKFKKVISKKNKQLKKKSPSKKTSKKTSNKSSNNLFSEMVLLKSNFLSLFIMVKDLVLKHYPDIDMPKKNAMILALINFSKTIQDIICNTTENATELFCDTSNLETPKNIKEIICKNADKLTDLNCDNIRSIIRMFENLLSVNLTDLIVEDTEKTPISSSPPPRPESPLYPPPSPLYPPPSPLYPPQN